MHRNASTLTSKEQTKGWLFAVFEGMRFCLLQSAEAGRKTERIEIVLDAGRKFFGVMGVTREEVQALLQKAF